MRAMGTSRSLVSTDHSLRSPLDRRGVAAPHRGSDGWFRVFGGPVTLSVVSTSLISELLDGVKAEVDLLAAELIEFRRDLHAHPELSWAEERTSAVIAKRLDEAGLTPRALPRNGLVVDIGSGSGPMIGLRADLDALPVEDRTDDPWASTVAGVAHACGHDLHASSLLGAGLALAALGDRLPGRVRLIFQPAEEIMPGGALMSIEAGAVDGVSRIFGLHADPGLDVGTVGLREGPLTGAADHIDVLLSGKGGHTSRPHLTEDLTFALGKVVTELPAVLSRRLDPRAGVSVVWGMIRAGSAVNVIPATGRAGGTVRMLDAIAWADAEELIRDTIDQIVEPYGVTPTVTYVRGVPPVVNEHRSTVLLGQAVVAVLGEEGHVATSQSLGGEDFAWYLDSVPGAMARLGTRTPGGPTYDLHQGDLRVDERAISVGASVLSAAALVSMVTDA
jgi:amidohydrolase